MNIIFHIFTLLFLFSSCVGMNPYETLNVKRSDSQKIIKAAYKKLAKEWHPDKNTSPDAQAQMVKINEAYEILSDAEKKEQYDRYGTTDKLSQQEAHHHFYHEFRKGPGGSYSFMFEDFPFGSNFHSHAQRKSNLLTRYSYQNIILPDSYQKVFLIGIFGDFCYDCLRLQPMWEKLSDNMDSIGIGVYELNYHRNPHLAYDIGSQAYPQFFAVINGRSIRYKNSEITERFIRDFISSLLPHSLVDWIVGNEKDYFEQSFKDNKPQCILFSKHMFVPLLFGVVAFEYQSKMKFAYVDVKNELTRKFREKYDIYSSDPTVVIVKEEPSTPVVVTRGSALKRGTLRELVSQNLYFYVPRLSSQTLFDELCPKESVTKRWLCVVLVTSENSDYSPHLWKLRQMAKDKQKFEKKRVRFFHIFTRKQDQFLNTFEPNDVHGVPCFDGSNTKDLLILWRLPQGKVFYDWFPNGWCTTDSSVKELEQYVDELVDGEAELRYQVEKLPDLKDEHYHGRFWDFIKSAYSVVQHVVDSLDSPSWYNASSIGFVILVLLGIMISCVLPIASEFISDPSKQNLPTHKPNTGANTTILGLKKLDAKTQKKFVHDSQPGKITIAVVVDALDVDDVASSPIIQAFADAIYGYTSNSCYTFTWLSIAENLIWCTEIMSINKFGEFLPGTVLAMNGFRKYVYVFKPNVNKNGSNLSANFIGFESSEEEGDSYQQLETLKVKKAAVRLRQDLPRWLERLFEGTLPNKIKIEKWPMMES